MLLQKTEEMAKARQNVSEMLLSQISEDMRQQRRIKEQAFKRVSVCVCVCVCVTCMYCVVELSFEASYIIVMGGHPTSSCWSTSFNYG